MVTLSSIVIAVPFGVLGGLQVAISGHRSPRSEMVIRPVLHLMQTVPVFASLVPVLTLLGLAPVAALIAPIIYSIPPLVPVSMLSLSQAPRDAVDSPTHARRQRN